MDSSEIDEFTDYYQLLEIPEDAEPNSIKKAYYKAARKWHPDHNGDNKEEATRVFQLIQHAYTILSDPNERAWYDGHRNLETDAEGQFIATSVDIMGLFNANAYHGFGDGPHSFYSVFSRAFSKIAEDDKQKNVPIFGNDDTPYLDVERFYNFWCCFKTVRDFSFVDKYHLSDAPNAIFRRYMEKENQKLRDKNIRIFQIQVRQLAEYARKRDPRVTREIERLKQEKADRLAKAEEERQKRLEKLAQDFERWANEPKQEMDEEALRYLHEFDSKEEEGGFKCDYCNRTLKTESAFRSHCNTKKHRKAVQKPHHDFIENPTLFDHSAYRFILLCLTPEEIEQIGGSDIDLTTLSLEEEEGEIEEPKEPKKGAIRRTNFSEKGPKVNEVDEGEEKEEKKEEEKEEEEEEETQTKGKKKGGKNQKMSKKDRRKLKLQEKKKAEDEKLKQAQEQIDNEMIKKSPSNDSGEKHKLSKKEKARLKSLEEAKRRLEEYQNEDEIEDVPPPQVEEPIQQKEEKIQEEKVELEPIGSQDIPQATEENEAEKKEEKPEDGKKSKKVKAKKPPPGWFQCKTCKECFPSKSKLFKHLNETKHAVYKY